MPRHARDELVPIERQLHGRRGHKFVENLDVSLAQDSRARDFAKALKIDREVSHMHTITLHNHHNN